jgi:hypothetical protein
MNGRHLFLVCYAAILIGTSATQAQATPPNGQVTDADVAQLIKLALDNIQRARCGKQSCAPASADEFANPPITVIEAREILHRGWISGEAEICGLDWQSRNFLSMMAHWRSHKKTKRQLASVALLHGLGQEEASQALSGSPCIDEDKRNLDAQLTFKP